jgi:lipopolysaccharide transport system permease protein
MTDVLRPFKSLIRSCIRTFRKPLNLLISTIPLNEAEWAKVSLLKNLIQRSMESRYKGSILGNIWPLLNQLSQLLIYTYVFSVVLQVKLSLKGVTTESPFIFGLWLFAGLLPWTAFSNGLLQSAESVLSNSNLVKKVVFPLTLLPLVPVGSTFIESTFGLIALITFVALSTNAIHATLWLLPLVFLTQLMLTTGLSFLISSLTVFIRDIPQTLSVVLNLWLYLTPIIYPADLIPEPFRHYVLWFNPMSAIAEIYRDIVLVGEINHWYEWAVSSLISAIVFLCGFWCYRKLRPAFADVL